MMSDKFISQRKPEPKKKRHGKQDKLYKSLRKRDGYTADVTIIDELPKKLTEEAKESYE